MDESGPAPQGEHQQDGNGAGQMRSRGRGPDRGRESRGRSHEGRGRGSWRGRGRGRGRSDTQQSEGGGDVEDAAHDDGSSGARREGGRDQSHGGLQGGAHDGGGDDGRRNRGRGRGRLSVRGRGRGGNRSGVDGGKAGHESGARVQGDGDAIVPEAGLPARVASETTCVICAEALDAKKHRPGVGPCGHLGTCALCYLRLRLLLNEMACCMCKVKLDHVYVFTDPSAVRPYASLQIYGNVAGPGMVYDEKAAMFMPREFYSDVFQVLQSPRCTIAGCGVTCKSVQALRSHLTECHSLYMCDVCLEDKKVFVGEQKLYTRSELDRHRDKGDPAQGVTGHPRCKFCKGKRFYDGSHLYQHLQRDHYECDICVRRGVRHLYFRDYKDLERHFRLDHFLCEDPGCLERRFVVFDSAIDLQAHQLAEHPGQGASRRVTVAFRVRGQQEQNGRGGDRADGGSASDRSTDSEDDEPSAGHWRPSSATGLGQTLQDPQAFPELSAEATRAAVTRMFVGPSASAVVASNLPTVPPPSARSAMDADFPALSATLRTRPTPTRPTTTAWGASSAPPAQRLQPRDPSQDGMLQRNRRLAEALGVEKEGRESSAWPSLSGGGSGGERGDPLRAYQLELERPVYPRELLMWAMQSKMDVLRLEAKIETFLRDEKNASLYLKPMPREERRRIHMLAECYNMKTVSYDPEPQRYVALIKTKGVTRAPVVLLSEAAEEAAKDIKARGQLGPGIRDGRVPPSQQHPHTLIVSHMREGVSGKAVIDTLKRLVPRLPVVAYRYEGSPDGHQQTLVIDLATSGAIAEVMDKLRAATEIFPFRVRRGGETALAQSRPSPAQQPPPPPPGLELFEPKEGGDGGSGGQRWSHSALKGKLAPRTRPIERSEEERRRMEEEAKALKREEERERRRRERGAKKEEALAVAEGRPGEGRVVNRWAGLESDDEEGEGDEDGSTDSACEPRVVESRDAWDV